MGKVNYRLKWEESEVEKLELHKIIQELRFKINAVKKILEERTEE